MWIKDQEGQLRKNTFEVIGVLVISEEKAWLFALESQGMKAASGNSIMLFCGTVTQCQERKDRIEKGIIYDTNLVDLTEKVEEKKSSDEILIAINFNTPEYASLIAFELCKEFNATIQNKETDTFYTLSIPCKIENEDNRSDLIDEKYMALTEFLNKQEGIQSFEFN